MQGIDDHLPMSEQLGKFMVRLDGLTVTAERSGKPIKAKTFADYGEAIACFDATCEQIATFWKIPRPLPDAPNFAAAVKS